MAAVWPIVCLTGPRPQHLTDDSRTWVQAKLHDAARWLVEQRGTQVGISGMALGCDTWWAEAVLAAGLTLGAHVPFPQQPDRWTAQDQQVWRDLCGRADAAHSRTYADAYSNQALHARNAGMLAASAAVVCVWCPNRREGGTYSAVRTAQQKRMAGVHLDPCARTVRLGLPDVAGSSAVSCPHGGEQW